MSGLEDNSLDYHFCFVKFYVLFHLFHIMTTNDSFVFVCLSTRTRDVDASSCLAHPTSVDVAECGSCKGCFSLGNIADVNIVCLKHAY